MKELASFEQGLGGDGATIKGSAGVESANLVAKVEVKFPLEKIVEKVSPAFDKFLDKIKAAIPGTWDDALIEQFKLEYKQDIVEILAD